MSGIFARPIPLSFIELQLLSSTSFDSLDSILLSRSKTSQPAIGERTKSYRDFKPDTNLLIADCWTILTRQARTP